jgi:methylated-DNA-[protein]-cysteine S-methyltransferase
MNTVWSGSIEGTPLGTIWTAVSTQGLVAVQIGGDSATMAASLARLAGAPAEWQPERLTAANQQIAAYLSGEQKDFDLPIDWSVLTPFQATVLRQVIAIPYGQITTYGELARRLGKSAGSSRAVGQANATNPMPLVIPCHRVVGADGRLHGYGGGGGLETKAWLLRLEGSYLL